MLETNARSRPICTTTPEIFFIQVHLLPPKLAKKTVQRAQGEDPCLAFTQGQPQWVVHIKGGRSMLRESPPAPDVGLQLPERRMKGVPHPHLNLEIMEVCLLKVHSVFHLQSLLRLWRQPRLGHQFATMTMTPATQCKAVPRIALTARGWLMPVDRRWSPQSLKAEQ